MGHPTHAAPPVPQAFTVPPVWQAPDPSQQPVQVAGPHGGGVSHVPETQASPEGHTTQSLPASPQSLVLVPAWHLPNVSQQPVQLDALQTGFWQ